ncbi:MAG TPA: adenosylcobalamin-dependent ribonucleoside-diphosphate reductase [Candidatus Saccharimonadia bacterium]|nr:adenosylcobalamin-dependent ribonucleoside-diphosphate reductase [Candidatus Saccharimonadia bacterium]
MTLSTVIKRDGRKVSFEVTKVARAIEKSGIETGEFDGKEANRLAEIVHGILEKVVGVRKEPVTVEQVQDTVEQLLMAAGHFNTAKAYILYRAAHANLRKAESAIGVENDLGLDINQLKVIERRYLMHDLDGKPTETPGQMFRRVARTLAGVEKSPIRKKWEDEFYKVMTKFEFLPGGRTLNNAGTPQNQLANCFVIPVEDSMEGIFDAVKWTAMVHQKGGGTGFNFSVLRPLGDSISKSSGGFATGPVSFMKVFDIATRQVMQGGKQRGANMGILSASHPDILEFITCKSEEGEISNFNISVGAQDDFMRAVDKDKEFDLVNPHNNTPVQTISARLLMDQIVSLAWRTGDPGMIYWDAINRNNPLLDSIGPIYATNPCGEQPLHGFDSCNLGSINLAAFITKNEKGKAEIDWDHLGEVARIATRMLDNVIDACHYPLPQITETVRQNRRIGLGVMGWADMLLQLGIAYNSDEAIKLAEKVMKHVQEQTWAASEQLAKEKGAFPRWKISWFAKGYDPVTHTYKNKAKPRKFRNVAITTIAPTGTISMASDTSSGIEPVFALSYIKNVVDAAGLTYINKHFERALRAEVGDNGEFNRVIQEIIQTGGLSHVEGVSNKLKQLFVTAHEISWEWHVRMQAAFQKHTDNAVSKTINFPSTASLEDVRGAYVMAWQLGCKGITVYRDNSKSNQVLSVNGATEDHKKELDTANHKSDKKKPKQIMQSQHRVTPLAQRRDFDALVKQEVYRDDVVDIAAAEQEQELCPECNTPLQFMEGCSLCPNCGYSKCKL